MMDVAIKDKWLNLDAKCRLCTDILCCKEHRIAHEDKMHPAELRRFLSAQNNNLNTTVSAVKLDKSSRNKSKATKEKIFKTPPTPSSTRKRKREAVSIPENLANQHLLQSLSKKKKNRSNILPYLRTPKENPKSPLAIINNGVKNEILIENNAFGSATKSSICLMKTSSPFSEGKENDFMSMTPIEYRSPEIMSCSGDIKNNNINVTPDMSYGLKKEPHDDVHNEMSDMEISRNSIETNDSKTESKVPKLENIANIVKFDESVRNGTQINKRILTDETNEIKPNTSSGEFQKNESFTSSGMSSPSFQDISVPLQLNSSDNFSNGSNQSGNLSGFQMILSPPDAFQNSINTGQNCIPNGHGKIDSNETMNDQIETDETMDEIFMTPVFNNNQSNDMSIDEFRTPSEWEHSTSVLQKCDSKTPKCPAVYRTPKVLEHRINNLEEKMGGNVSTSAVPQEYNHYNQADEKAKQMDESQFENRNETLFIKGSVKLQQISFECMNPKNLATLLQNPSNTYSKRDSGFQSLSDTSNMLSGNYSNRMAADNSNSLEEERIPLESPDPSRTSFNNDSLSSMHSSKNSDDLSCNISLRDCNIGEEFTLKLDPGMILDPGLLNRSYSPTDFNDISLNVLKNHPNINYERRKNIDRMFDVQSNECNLFSPTKLIERENDISNEMSEQSKADETTQSTVVVDQSVPDETINNSTEVIHQPISYKTIDSKADVHQSLSDEPIHETLVDDKSVLDENIHGTLAFDKSILDETTHNTAVVDHLFSPIKLIEGENDISIEMSEQSKTDETIHSTVVGDHSVLDENMHRTMVVYLDKIDYAKIEEHIRRRDPIREYMTTLEMSRKILKRVEGRGPYYSQSSSLSNAPSFITLKKEPKENENSPAQEKDQVEASCCVM